MAILEVILNQSFAGQLVVNRFHYIQSGTPAAVTPSFGLVSAMGWLTAGGSPRRFAVSTFARSLQTIQSQSLSYVSVYCRNLYSPTDFYETPFVAGDTGGAGGAASSPLLAFGFKSSRVRTDIRRAMKRFAGVNEEAIGTGGAIASGVVADIENMALWLGETLSYDDEGNTLTFVPAVLSFEEYTTSSGKRAYHPYATEAAQLSHSATGFTYAAYDVIRSQTSRQYGHGQ